MIVSAKPAARAGGQAIAEAGHIVLFASGAIGTPFTTLPAKGVSS